MEFKMDINEEIKNLTEAYANLLEANDKRGGAQKEVNKITRTKKDKNGEPIEVVSVADELFPYKGTAKEQYNQKILAKINDMIEGTATLDDLIQLVRSKKPAVNVKESLQETLDKMMTVAEEMINEIAERTKIDAYKKRVAQYREASDTAKKNAQDHMNWDAFKPAIKELEKADKAQQKEFRHRLRTMTHDQKFGQDAYNKAQKEMFSERKAKKLDETLSESKPKDPEGYKKNIEIANHYDNLYSKEPANAPDGSPNSVASEWNRRYQEYLDKAMKCYYGDGCKKSKKKAIKEAISLMEAIINEISQETKDNAWNKTYDEMVRYRGRLEDEKKKLETGWGHPDKVMKAKKGLWNAEDRYQKMDNAIRKHNRAKAEGKIKSCEKEEKEDDSK